MAKRPEIWKRRRARLLIDSDLTGVGISGRAFPLAAWSAAVGVDNKTATPIRLEAGARARGGAVRGRRDSARNTHIKGVRLRTPRTGISLFKCFLAGYHEGLHLMLGAELRRRVPLGTRQRAVLVAAVAPARFRAP